MVAESRCRTCKVPVGGIRPRYDDKIRSLPTEVAPNGPPTATHRIAPAVFSELAALRCEQVEVVDEQAQV